MLSVKIDEQFYSFNLLTNHGFCSNLLDKDQVPTYHSYIVILPYNLTNFFHLFIQVTSPNFTDSLAMVYSSCWHSGVL